MSCSELFQTNAAFPLGLDLWFDLAGETKGAYPPSDNCCHASRSVCNHGILMHFYVFVDFFMAFCLDQMVFEIATCFILISSNGGYSEATLEAWQQKFPIYHQLLSRDSLILQNGGHVLNSPEGGSTYGVQQLSVTTWRSWDHFTCLSFNLTE